MKYKQLFASIALLSAIGCQSQPLLQNHQTISRVSSFQSNLNTEAVIESKFNYSTDKATLTANFKENNGTVTVYRTIKSGNTVTAETANLQDGQEVNKHLTTPNEANLVIKVAASNGLADIYRDLRARYRLAGLTR